jgi:hypothetical protein
MAKILKRPMFRRGGSTNDGIMSGLTDRKQLANGTLDPERARREAKEIQDIMESLAPVRRTRLPLGEVGLALARGVDPLDALDAGYRDFIKRDDVRQALLDKRKQAAVSTALGSQLNRRNQSVLAAEKKAKFLLPPNASAEEIRAKTAEIIKSEMTGKTYSETANFRRTLESYRTQYGDGNKAFYHATFDEKIAPTLRQAGESPKGVYVDVDNGKIIRITSELEAIEVPELSKLFLQ